MNRKSPLMHHALMISPREFADLQKQIGVEFSQGQHESRDDFRTRVLTEVEKAGNMRLVETILNM